MSNIKPDSATQPPPSSKKYLYDVDFTSSDSPALLVGQIEPGAKVLEIGCASGSQSRVMKERGCKVTGIEIDPEAADQARAYCERVIVGNLESLDFAAALGAERFDVITIADVLEHLRQPEPVLRSVSTYLAPHGKILASIPNVVYAGLILDMAKGRFEYRPYGLLDDTHVRFFTLKSVLSLFEACGLEVFHLHRAYRPLERSEFIGDRTLSPEEVTFVEFIRRHNPECETYQFVVSGRPLIRQPMTAAEYHLRDQVKELQFSGAAQLARVRKLESEIAWMQRRPIRTFLSSVLRAVRPSPR